MSILQLWHGGGKRRRSTESWNDLERQLSDAQARAKHVKGATRNTCPADVHGPFWVHTSTPQPCPWCEIARLRGQIELLTMRPAPRPGGIAVQAPVDGATIRVPADEPAADVTAETQPVDVRDLRDALGESDTVTLPVVSPVTPVVDEPLPPLTWGTNPKALEDWATGTAPGPMHEVPVGLGSKASVKVHAVLEEAS